MSVLILGETCFFGKLYSTAHFEVSIPSRIHFSSKWSEHMKIWIANYQLGGLYHEYNLQGHWYL